MSDIVEQLRDWALDLRLPLTNKHVSALNEAAAEIERLRAERDEARAACAGMRTALKSAEQALCLAGDHLINCTGETPEEIAVSKSLIAVRAALSPTIGADVLAVVEALRKGKPWSELGDMPGWIGMVELSFPTKDDALAFREALAKLGEER